jgi:hypothetical protein
VTDAKEKRLKNLKPYKKGETGNPGGRPALPEDIKVARKLGQIELERLVNRHLFSSIETLKGIAGDTATTGIEAMVANIVLQAVAKGDQQRLDFILNRIIGKVQDRVEVTTPKPFIVERLDGTGLVLGAKVEMDE